MTLKTELVWEHCGREKTLKLRDCFGWLHGRHSSVSMLLFTAWGGDGILSFPSSLTHFDGQQDVAEESSDVQKMGDFSFRGVC